MCPANAKCEDIGIILEFLFGLGIEKITKIYYNMCIIDIYA
jgi:hypothetical protein